MASTKEAFNKLWTWKESNTLLKVTVGTKGERPETFIGAVTFPDEDSLQVGFANHDTRSMRSVDFSGCLFIVGERVLLAQREDEEFFECEDTGRRWGRPETPSSSLKNSVPLQL
jgi:hypothetical protein